MRHGDRHFASSPYKQRAEVLLAPVHNFRYKIGLTPHNVRGEVLLKNHFGNCLLGAPRGKIIINVPSATLTVLSTPINSLLTPIGNELVRE